MAVSKTPLCFLFASLMLLLHCSYGARTTPDGLVEEQPLVLTYHKGALLTGPISVNLIFYGKFAASQRAIIADFVTSLSSARKGAGAAHEPSVATWWKTLSKYYATSKTPFPRLTLGDQVLDESYSLGKSLKDADLAKLAAKGRRSYAINVVLTADDVAVEGFCMNRCGTHGSSGKTKAGRYAYVWVGNSAAQCPGYCAWPFHQPVYGPQSPPLVAPNGDVGVDGMVINLATLIAGTVTNPFGNGFFQGPKEAPLEAATACPGVYAKGAYPGYAGDLLLDASTGASYNANGAHGRKYLLPALYDPSTSSCSTLV